MATDWIALYLQEDLGPDGDITSDAIFTDETGAARLVLRQAGVVAGLAAAADVFKRSGVDVEVAAQDGDEVAAGSVVLTVTGPVRGILAAERLALNIVGRMSGIATVVRALAQVLAKECPGTAIAGTRKTTPGFRAFEKEAIRIGGGDPHRAGLWDEAMVKDNHRVAAGGVRPCVQRIRAQWPDRVLTVEVESLEEAMEAADAGADWIMIDNQDPETGRSWAEAVRERHLQVKFEASGGIAPDQVTAYGWADRISLGALTHQATSLDVGLDWEDA